MWGKNGKKSLKQQKLSLQQQPGLLLFKFSFARAY